MSTTAAAWIGMETLRDDVSRSEERRVGKGGRSLCDWSSDVCSSDLDGRRSLGSLIGIGGTFIGLKGQRRRCRRGCQVASFDLRFFLVDKNRQYRDELDGGGLDRYGNSEG